MSGCDLIRSRKEAHLHAKLLRPLDEQLVKVVASRVVQRRVLERVGLAHVLALLLRPLVRDELPVVAVPAKAVGVGASP